MDDLALSQLPSWSRTLFADSAFRQTYLFDLSLNPFFQSGDFDGDGFLDVAVLVREVQTGQRGVALLLQDDSPPFVLGVGEETSTGEDWPWLALWHVERRLPAGAGLAPLGHILIVSGLDGTTLWIFRDAAGWQVVP